jgi:hypothetical protein
MMNASAIGPTTGTPRLSRASLSGAGALALFATAFTPAHAEESTVPKSASLDTSIERDHDQVVQHLRTLGVTWPVAVDNSYALWKAYNVEYWPTQMLFDRRGKLRKVVIGDSQDQTVNDTINALLHESA